jgi:glycosyltransferase involved in cell wall biosynthesis
MDKHPNFAFVYDWLVEFGGAEKTLSALWEVIPEAPVHALVHNPVGPIKTLTDGHEVKTSFIQNLPLARRKYRFYFPLMPVAIEQFNLESYDVIISLSHAFAHGIIVSAEQIHINYIFTPIRFAWRLYHQYLQEAKLNSGPKSWIAKVFIHYLRLWDAATSNRVDHYLAISKSIAQNVWRIYRRHSEVIYPPVDLCTFTPRADKDNFYLTASRMVPYKRIPLIIEAFNRMPKRKLVVIGDGPVLKEARSKAGKNIEVLGFQKFERLKEYMEHARAFIFAANDDFGIAPLEAQACGTPVIAYRAGGALETIIEGKTGIFFKSQTVECLVAAVERFENEDIKFDLQVLRKNAERFSKERFKREIGEFIDKAWDSKQLRYK